LYIIDNNGAPSHCQENQEFLSKWLAIPQAKSNETKVPCLVASTTTQDKGLQMIKLTSPNKTQVNKWLSFLARIKAQALQMIKQTCPNKAEGCKRNTNNQATLTHWNKAQGYK